MESGKDFFNNWQKSQEKNFEDLMETMRKLQQDFWGLGVSGGGTRYAGGVQNIYTSWTTAMLNALGEMGTEKMSVINDTIFRTMSSSNAYVKLYEIWLPLFKAIQEKTLNPDSYKDLADPAKYKEVLDNIFGFYPDAISGFSTQAAKLLETFAGSTQEFMKPWAEATEKSFKTFPQFMEGYPESGMNIFHNMFTAFDSTIGRIFHVPPVGKDREKIELLLRSFDDLSVYIAKSIAYQHMMYVTGLTTTEKVIATIAEKIKSGEEIKKFDDFFDLWTNVNEKTYYALFQTEDFSKMQGELLEAALNVRKHFFKLMELHLYDFPIALRSEMDDLYKTIYELKKKVKSLEKQFTETRAL